MFKKIVYSFIALLVMLLGRFLLRGDFLPFLQWWVTVLLLGIIFLPLSNLLFAGLHDRGYLFAKTIGIAVTGYLMWLFSSLHILKFTTSSCMISVAVSFLINGVILLCRQGKRGKAGKVYSFPQTGKKYLEAVITEELLFLGLFLVFTYIRGFKPQAYGTEKFMDYGFMTSMMRSEYMPPQDFWFSGTKLNYYYVGQYMAVFLTKLSFVPVSDGYNLMLMMTGAFAFVLPCSIVYNLVLRYQNGHGGPVKNRKQDKFLPCIGGLLGGAGVCIAGNMHYTVYQWIEPAVRQFFGIEKAAKRYWFPDATRFIGYHPETNDKTIHEFPSYSFVLGDLHAHVINILFVLTVIGILLGWMYFKRAAKEQKQPVWKEIFHPSLIMLGFFIGLFHMTNFWDFPIYYVVSGAVILFSNMIVYNFKGKAYWITALEGIVILGLSTLVSLPFTLCFDQISTKIRLAEAHTPLNQLIILWGLPFFAVISFLCFLIGDFKRNYTRQAEMQEEPVKKQSEITRKKETSEITRKKETKGSEKAKRSKKVKRRKKPAVFRFMETMDSSDLFVLILGLCAIGLVLIPEILYVEDIYSGDYKRANTMFKLTYQAFILFGISFGYLWIRLIRFGTTARQKRAAWCGFILFLSSLFYAGNAVNAWYGNIFDRKAYKGIDAAAFMKKEMPDDYLATCWLNDNVSGMPVILEANGDSYTDYQRVSVITGLPTVLGWHTHEWLWKGDPSLLDRRSEDIKTIYTSAEEEMVRALLRKYKVEYIYVGKLEQEKYENVNHELIKNLGRTVFYSPATENKDYETYIVRINE